MKFLRFILPFLFVRNWHDGVWELSRARLILFTLFILLLALGFFIVSILQAPVVYNMPGL